MSEAVRRQAITDLSVVVERLDNVKEKIECNHQENKDEHEKIMKKQDFTNGKVRALQIWKATMAGALAIISMVSGYVINDYITNREEVAESVHTAAANYEIVKQNTENIKRLEQVILELKQSLKEHDLN